MIFECIRRVVFAASLVACAGLTAAAAQPVSDDFERGPLAKAWSDCQIDAEAPLRFENGAVVISVGEESLGGDHCYPPAPMDGTKALLPDLVELAAPFGPIFAAPDRDVAVMAFTSLEPDTYCDADAMARAVAAGEEGTCIQRQEIRAVQRFSLKETVEYEFRLRMEPGQYDRSRDTRYVLAQWKLSGIDDKHYCGPFGCGKRWGQSPFLAFRFNNAQLYATVQDETCRCAVTALGEGPAKVGPFTPTCSKTRDPKGAPSGGVCTPRFTVTHGPHAIMSDPIGEWRTIKVLMRGSQSDDGEIAIWEDGEMVATIRGRFGWKAKRGKTPKAKFKFGHYRDYIPFPTDMSFDWVKITPK